MYENEFSKFIQENTSKPPTDFEENSSINDDDSEPQQTDLTDETTK